ncbi:prolyl oligopeptidase family serine peptidase [Lysobacter korlensis]
MSKLGRMAALVAGLAMAVPATAVDIRQFIQRDKFESIKLSPEGDYYAMTVPLENYTALVIVRRADSKLTGTFRLQKNSHVDDFWWVNPERVVLSIAEKLGSLDEPQPTGELYAINADGTKADILVGQRIYERSTGTHIQTKKAEQVAAFLVDDLPNDDGSVVISVMPFSTDPFTRAERLDVYSGRRTPLARAPVRNARFMTDNRGVVRFARGVGVDNVGKLYYRTGEGSEWQLLADEARDDGGQWPVGFSADDRTAYLQVERPEGPDAIVAFDVQTQTSKEIIRDEYADPDSIIYRNGTAIPVGAFLGSGRTRTVFFQPDAPEARLYRSLESAFPGHNIRVTSQSSDGRLALVGVWSDRSPGDFYLFDSESKKADYLLSRREAVDPEKMAEMRPIQIDARDGMKLHGYLTVPQASNGKNLPMVVLPHGGPFGIRDRWGFSIEPQMLAQAGYAVLQLNFRGSGGYGQRYMEAGARQWGGAMQDDLTDATRWAIAQGIADAGRICIYGASYGGYASLMGVAKEPSLYRCAVGYIGVYDLPLMQAEDTRASRRYANWSNEWVGTRDALAAVSPNRLADRIKVPVFLAAGGEDEVAPIKHTRLMEQALREAGVPVETLYFPTEGHGFYVEKNRIEYYTRLLAFLSRHLGGATASTGAAARDSTAAH